MALLHLQFGFSINVSVQVGDILYYVSTQPIGIDRNWESTTTPHHSMDRESVIRIGPVLTVNEDSLEVDMDDAVAAQYGPPKDDDFIMFSKDNKVNLSSLLGYYSLIKLRNNSTEKAEIFTVGSDFQESSK